MLVIKSLNGWIEGDFTIPAPWKLQEHGTDQDHQAKPPRRGRIVGTDVFAKARDESTTISRPKSEFEASTDHEGWTASKTQQDNKRWRRRGL
jgi:hypothetical protein